MKQIHHEGVIVEELDDRVIVTLNRPEVRNAVNAAMVASLHEVCSALESSPRPAILTGGASVFAAGADISELAERGRLEALAGINSGLFERVAKLPLPTVAAIGGPAIGGGAELAFACDFRIGTPDAIFANPEGQLGIAAGAGGTWRLVELVGESLAKEMLLAGRRLDADDALRVHLLNEVVPAIALMDTAHAWIDRILRSSPISLRLGKALIHAPRESHPLVDNIAQAVLFETEEKRQRMQAFLSERTNH